MEKLLNDVKYRWSHASIIVSFRWNLSVLQITTKVQKYLKHREEENLIN